MAAIATEIEQPTAATVWQTTAASAIDDRLVEWPPDVLALTQVLLERSAAYRFALSPPAGNRWRAGPGEVSCAPARDALERNAARSVQRLLYPLYPASRWRRSISALRAKNAAGHGAHGGEHDAERDPAMPEGDDQTAIIDMHEPREERFERA